MLFNSFFLPPFPNKLIKPFGYRRRSDPGVRMHARTHTYIFDLLTEIRERSFSQK